MKKITNNSSKLKNYAKKEKYSPKNKITSPKNNSKAGGKTPVKHSEGSFLYLIPNDISAGQLHDGLDFLNEKQLEVWTQINLLEVTTDEGTVTFEDMKDNLRGEDSAVLDGMGIKKVYAVDYYLSDKGVLRKIMETLTSKFGGKIGSDTEDFQPFIKVNEL